MKVLYEILVPTIYGDSMKPIRTRHHKEWDKFVKKVTGGLTILSPAKGIWVNEGVDYPEKVIPVRVMCEEPYESAKLVYDNRGIWVGTKFPTGPDTYQIDKIIDFTIKHYRQKAVMFYVISNQVNIKYASIPAAHGSLMQPPPENI